MISAELEKTMFRMLDGELSASEADALETDLIASPEARVHWKRLAAIHSALETHHSAASAIEGAPVVPIERVIARQRLRLVKASLAAAAAVMLMAAGTLWMINASEAHSGAASLRLAANSVYALSHPESGKISSNTLDEGSTLSLDHGVAELRLPHDVRAMIEAPARVSIIDGRTLQMDFGHAFFEVKSAAGEGFTVVTPRQRIVDLGTAFGVVARPGAPSVELHVFDGRVRVDAPDGGRGETVAAGQSVRLEGNRVAEPLAGAPASFLRELPERIETLFSDDFSNGLLADREYAVFIDRGVILNAAGKTFEGIADGQGWAFRTASAAPDNLPVRNSGFEEDGQVMQRGMPIAAWHPGSESDWGWGVDRSRASLSPVEGKFFGRVFTGRALSQLTDTIIHPGTTYVLTVDVGLADSAATLRLFGGDPENVLAETTLSSASEGWLKNQSLLFTAGASHPDGQLLGIAMTCPSGNFALFDRVRLGTPGHDAHDQFHLVVGTDVVDELEAGERPQILSTIPAVGATDAAPGGPLVIHFDQAIRPGSGLIRLRNKTDWSEEVFMVGDSRLSIDGARLIIQPPAQLEDGDIQSGCVGGWESTAWAGILNPAGDGTWYRNDRFRDQRGRHGPILATLDAAVPRSSIRRPIGTVQTDTRHGIGIGIGVRDSGTFAGYHIRLVSGETVLAELASTTPPGPANEISHVGFSWDSSRLPDGIAPGAPLTLVIAPHANATSGYLDLDEVRVTVLEGQ